MQNTPETYNIEHEDTFMLNEPATLYAKQTQTGMRRINTQKLIDEGYMTLDQSKALIEKKIYNHFHN